MQPIGRERFLIPEAWRIYARTHLKRQTKSIMPNTNLYCFPNALRGLTAGIFAVAVVVAGAGCTIVVHDNSSSQNQNGRSFSRNTVIVNGKVFRGGKGNMALRTIEQSVPIASVKAVEVRSPFGEITLVPSKSADAITIHAEIALSDNSLSVAQRKKYLDGFSIETKNEGGKLHISAKPPADFPRTLGFQCDFRVGVPQGAALELNAETENGAVRIEETSTTGAVDARSEFGEIVVKGAGNGADIEAHTSNGAVRVENPDSIAPRNVVAESEFGSITVSGQAETIEAKSSNGAVTVSRATKARTISAHSDFGSVKVKDCGGDVRAETSNGSVFIGGSPTQLVGKSDFGAVEANLVDGAAPKSLELTTSNGAVRLTVPQTANLKIKAHTSNGSITASGLGGEKNGDSFEKSYSAVLGTGASDATLRSDFGSISITAR